MNTKNVLSFVAFFFLLATSVNAQQLYKLYGNITDLDGNALQGASVLVSAITDKDTIVSGCITDADGRYETLFEPTDTIRIRASLLGYRTRETVLAVKGETMTHDIALERSSVVLDEVSVEAEGAVLNAKGISYYPNDRQKKSAYDGTSLLRNLAIPSLQINPENNSITTNTREEVAIFIDGRPASQNEISMLRPKDVIRVEFYEQPMPEFMNKANVVNYVMRKYDTGGYVALRGNQYFIPNNGGYMAFAKIHHKKWMFNVMGSGGYGIDNRYGSDLTENFHLDNGVAINRSLLRVDGSSKQKQATGAFMAYYTDSLFQYTTSVVASHNGQNSWNTNTLNYLPEVVVSSTSRTDTENKTNMIYWENYFSKTMNKGQKLTGKVDFQYNRQTYSRHYAAMTDVANLSNADNYTAGLSVVYSKSFKHNNILTIEPQTKVYLFDNHYRGSSISDQRIVKSESSLGISYAQQIGKKISLQAKMAGIVSTYGETNYKTTTDIIPNPSLNINYRINSRHSINANASFAQYAPSASQLNAVDMPIDELIVLRGNPDLDIFQNMDARISYTALLGKLSLNAFGYVSTSFDNTVLLWKPEGGKMIETYTNSGNCTYTSFGVNPVLSLLNRTLTFYGGIAYNPQFQTGIYDRHYNELQYWGGLNWYRKNFSVQAYYNSPRLNINVLGYKYTIPQEYGILVSYFKNNFMIFGGYSNWFHNREYVQRELYAPSYSLNERTYTNISPKVWIGISYIFEFGKKVKYENAPQLNTKSNSGLLLPN